VSSRREQEATRAVENRSPRQLLPRRQPDKLYFEEFEIIAERVQIAASLVDADWLIRRF